MEAKKILRIMIKVALIAMIAFTLFWGAWYLITGSIPSVETIKMTEGWSIILPFAIPRWTDIPLAGIFACLLVLLFTNKGWHKRYADEIEWEYDYVVTLYVGFLYGIIVGLGAGLICSACDLGAGLGVGLLCGLAVGLFWGPVGGLGFSLACMLGIGLNIGLFYMPALVPVAGLGFGIGVGLKYLFTREFCKKIGHFIEGVYKKISRFIVESSKKIGSWITK
ncbi:MAG: hypothetical protein PHS07_00290 [Patescibacteria group bacterium]|nr:hypothetical protein [Patescibacteria group bacterium]